MRKVNEIIVHCAFTKPSMDIDADWIRKIHVHQNGWNDIGYHFFIKRDGTLERGRLMEIAGAHCHGHNRQSVGVCLAGGMSEESKPEDNFTPEQFAQLKLLVHLLEMIFSGIKKVSGHYDYSSKPCPCFNVQEKFPEYV